MARLVHPLVVKVQVHVQVPLSWQGGTAVPLEKGSGESRLSVFHRQVILMNSNFKHHRRFLENLLLSIILFSFGEIQCGGLEGRSTAMASNMAWTCLLLTEQGKVSAILFSPTSRQHSIP